MSAKKRNEITPQHRNRLAVEYRRHSTTSPGPEHQDSQAHHARTWGWPESAIQVINEDAGRSGSGADNRPGFQRLYRMVEAGQVGLVLVSDLTRLSRSRADLLTFL